jgi:molecular chaperone DnaJ
LGGDFVVPTPYGDETVKIPAGSQTETVLRLRGKGLPRLGHSGKGDLHVRVHVWTPEHLSDAQEDLFRQLAEIEGAPPQQEPGFWSKLKEALGA